MNVLIDSYGWIEYFSGGPRAGLFGRHIARASPSNYFTPAIVIYEVYKQLKKMRGKQCATNAVSHIAYFTEVVGLDAALAILAADISIEHSLSMADAIIKATAEQKNAKIVTSDMHFKGFPETISIK